MEDERKVKREIDLGGKKGKQVEHVCMKANQWVEGNAGGLIGWGRGEVSLLRIEEKFVQII